jgi:hypothetical protein
MELDVFFQGSAVHARLAPPMSTRCLRARRTRIAFARPASRFLHVPSTRTVPVAMASTQIARSASHVKLARIAWAAGECAHFRQDLGPRLEVYDRF